MDNITDRPTTTAIDDIADTMTTTMDNITDTAGEQIINKNLNLDISQYKSLDDATQAAETKFRELNPEPVPPNEARRYKRASVVNLGSQDNPGYVWVSVDPKQNDPVIKINHKGLNGNDAIDISELETLVRELNSAKTNFNNAKADAQERKTFDKHISQWKQALEDCYDEVRNAWIIGHPEDEDES